MVIRIDWKQNEFCELVARVPATDYHRTPGSYYEISAQLRPPYCDRGQYLVLVDAVGLDPLDHQEGFPRYYFSLGVMMIEMNAWVNKRATCLLAERLAAGKPEESAP